MSDIYIPELVELDSYWQKAVEDAIRDTVKGEEKLHNALRNRKKINEKLQKFGLKPILSRLRFAKTGPQSARARDSESDSEASAASMEIDEEFLHTMASDKSRSKSAGSPFEDDKQKSPTRPLFGNGSLEKIKKSQNSFNCEPMGEEGTNEELSEESEKDENEKYAMFSGENSQEEWNKNIQWLHVREDRDFENSDSESTWAEDDQAEKAQFQIHPFPKNKNNNVNEKSGFRSNSDGKTSRMSKKAQSQQDLLCEEESNDAAKEQKGLERRLHLALAKREILNKKLKTPGGAKSNAIIKVSRSAAKVAEKQRKGKKQLSSFIKFYLEVYRDLYHKMPVKRIAEEAAKRWRNMNMKEKAKWADDSQIVNF